MGDYAMEPCTVCLPCEHSARKRRRRKLPKTPEIAAARMVAQLISYQNRYGQEAFLAAIAFIQRSLFDKIAA